MPDQQYSMGSQVQQLPPEHQYSMSGQVQVPPEHQYAMGGQAPTYPGVMPVSAAPPRPGTAPRGTPGTADMQLGALPPSAMGMTGMMPPASTVAPGSVVDQHEAYQRAPPPLPPTVLPPATMSPASAMPPTAALPLPGVLHMALTDWDPGVPEQHGQMRMEAGTLIGITQEAAHGWVYGTQPGHPSKGGAPIDGWVPKAMLKRVSLCQVFVDWPADSSGTLSVRKGELIAVSHEAERGWVYGEKVSPSGHSLQPPTHSIGGNADGGAAGWLPKKVLECVQA
mmetsp:Transcript_133364/g.245202  ORF Transcript_133364/g.245202 Transcript_133364/m.245202 type:complete len:281 (-) Transcript_133364:110-952(-)